jgi:DNA repair protein RadA/Sms
MARDGAVYACQSCGAVTTKWSGQCSACQSWNSLVEETGVRAPGALSVTKASRARGLQFTGLESDTPAPPRIITGVDEFDRVCGGGVVPGSAILIGGDPGVGKSTLLLEVVAKASLKGVNCAYISGEEAVAQIRGRAERMGFAQAPVKLAAESSLRDILDGLKRDNFDLVVIDSIQTMWSDAHEAGPGHGHPGAGLRPGTGAPGQEEGRGDPAGRPRHQGRPDRRPAGGRASGRRGAQLRGRARLSVPHPARGQEPLRGHRRDRGVRDGRLRAARGQEPLGLFLNEGGERAAGAAVFAGIEGSRPVLVEFQALVAPSAYGTPRRAVVGWDSGRLAMVLAVLESRCGLGFGNKDVYLNVAGGLRITEPAADLAAAAALASSALDIALPQDCVVFGEVSLSGEVRPVSRMETRLKEAAKLGFGRALGPLSGLPEGGGALPVAGVARLADAVRRIGDEIWGQLT